MDYFGFLVGNCMLSFMWHHSTPNIVRPIRPETSINKVLLLSNVLAYIITLIVTITAVIAYGNFTNSCTSYPCKI